MNYIIKNIPQNRFLCDLALKFLHLDGAFLDEYDGLKGETQIILLAMQAIFYR